jgi:hypothetical protein
MASTWMTRKVAADLNTSENTKHRSQKGPIASWLLTLTFEDDTETTFTNLLSDLVVHSNDVARPTATARTGTCRIGTCSHQTGGRVSLAVVSHGSMR